jgi:hypothetical protein
MARQDELDPRERDFYVQAMRTLEEHGVPVLVGGAYALARYTGIVRHTKDFDLFLHRRDYDRAMGVLERLGCRTELTFPHWLGKAHREGLYVDLIFSSGNAIAEVDDTWFQHAVPSQVLGYPARLCPAEEMIWSKSFIMERERFDGADVLHILYACGARLDWRRLLERFGEEHWRVLLAHLVMFGFVYPGARGRVPEWVMQLLVESLARESDSDGAALPLCRGPILSREQYLVDLYEWGLEDARRRRMSDHEIARWTAGIEDDGGQRRAP